MLTASQPAGRAPRPPFKTADSLHNWRQHTNGLAVVLSRRLEGQPRTRCRRISRLESVDHGVDVVVRFDVEAADQFIDGVRHGNNIQGVWLARSGGWVVGLFCGAG